MSTNFAPTPRNRPGAARRLNAILTGILALAMLATGCVEDGNGDGGEDQPTGSIVNITSNIRVSGDQMVSVVYSAGPEAADVDAFYVEVDSTALNASTIGARVVFAQNLPTGEPPSTVTTLNTALMPLGIYRVGLNIVSGDETLRVLSLGTIEITTLPEPEFTLPNQDLFEQPGGNIAVSANVGDPENAVQWRLFYVEEGQRPSVPPTEYGTQLAVGTANVAQTTWFTAGVDLGRYEIGIFVTDSGQSIADTVAAGNTDDIKGPFFNPFIVTLTTDPPEIIPPSVVVSQPSTNQSILVADPTDPNDGNVLMEFSVNVFQGPPSLQFVDVFYDFDGQANTGDEQVISANLPISTTNAVFRVASIDAGTTAFLGVTATDAVTTPVTAYAPGTVRRLNPNEALLQVTQPSSPLNRNIGEAVGINWTTTNVPSDAEASFNVYVRRVNSAGNPLQTLAQATPINTSGLPVTTTSTQYIPTESGRFLVTVQLNFANNLRPPLCDNAGPSENSACNDPPSTPSKPPVLITVSTLPSIFWLGTLDPLVQALGIPRQLDGAIFEGVNFEDNAGSSMAGGEDFDDDGFDECVIVARYGKPEFVNPSGVGAGEAYLLRGRAQRYNGLFSLNAVGSTPVPGVVFTGIEPDPLPDDPNASDEETDGIASVFITPGGVDEFGEPADADGDQNGEIIFGFPRTRSQKFFVLGGVNKVFPDFLTGLPIETCFPGAVAVARTHDGWSIPHFLRGGIVAVSSLSLVLSTQEDDRRGPRVFLDRVGQIFDHQFSPVLHAYENASINPRTAARTLCAGANGWLRDRLEWDDSASCPTGEGGTGGFVGCFGGRTDGELDSLEKPLFGFDPRLADPWPCNFLASLLGDEECDDVANLCPACDFLCAEPDDCTTDQFLTGPVYNAPIRELIEDGATNGIPDCLATLVDTTCEGQKDFAADTMPIGQPRLVGFNSYRSGVYVERLSDGQGETASDWNDAVERSPNSYGHLGARVIGRDNFDAAGTSFTYSNGDLIVVSPFAQERRPDANGGEGYIIRFNTTPGNNRGLPRYWQIPARMGYSASEYARRFPPARPHQYLCGGQSVTQSTADTNATGDGLHDTWFEFGDIRIIGDVNELIENVVGVPDFNGDNRGDIAIGAPRADVNGDGAADGAVYIIYRRDPNLEGDFRLANLKLNTSDVERLDGLLVRETLGDGQRFGESVAGDFDFNHDGRADVVVGNPDGNGGTGEVIIIFGLSDTISQAQGIPIESEGANLGLLARRRGARITGVEAGSEFGIFVANVGDVDADGLNDLAIVAPNATPMFDSNPFDAVDVLDTPGLDGVVDASVPRDGIPDAPNGIADDVSGPLGLPDGQVNINDQLRHAGLVYIVLSSTIAQSFASSPAGQMNISISQLGRPTLPGFIIVGRHGDRFALGDPSGAGGVVHPGDFLGAGFAGATTRTIPHTNPAVIVNYGGNPAKAPLTIYDEDGNPRLGGDNLPLLRERGRAFGVGRGGDLDGDGAEDLLLGAQLADPRVDPITGEGTKNGGEAYVIYGFTD